MTDIGQGALLLALVFSGHTAVAAYLSARWSRPALLASARRSAQVTFALATLAVGLLTYLLLARDYQVRYVYQHVNSTLSPVYTLSALWAGQEGSLLVWFWFLCLFGVLLAGQRSARTRDLEPYALGALAVTEVFFALLLCSMSKPFAILPARAADGVGLNPLLQNPGMIYHPPTLLFGYAAYTVPFAYAFAALASGNVGPKWVRAIRRWHLLAWGTLGLGILMGAQWAYVELGWGGYWGWDPVENASLVPWLTGTALVHSVIMQERRGLFRVWNLVLAIGTFLLCIFATFVTRSGLIQSVHAFSASPIGYYFLAYIGVVLAVSVGLLVRRRTVLQSDATLEEALSREGMFLVTNLLFTGLASAVMLGTLFPSLTGVLGGTPIVLDRTFYERVSQPLALALLALLGVCPLLGWRRSRGLGRVLALPLGVGLATGIALALRGMRGVAPVAFGLMAFVVASLLEELIRGVRARRDVAQEAPWIALRNLLARNRRRYAGYTVHLAVILMAAGITGEGLFKVEIQATVPRGEAVALGPYQIRYEELSSERLAAVERHEATMGVYLGGERVATLRPQLNLHYSVNQLASEVAIHTTLGEDIYVAVLGIDAGGSAVTIHALLNPLMVWLWIGGIVMLGGTVLALWPEREATLPEAVSAPRRATS